jgi:hypothetical protein
MVIYERVPIPRAERKIYELELVIEDLEKEVEFYKGAYQHVDKVLTILRKQIAEQDTQIDALVAANQSLEYDAKVF